MVEEIRALKELLDMGAITQEEYDKKKADILGIASGGGPSCARSDDAASARSNEAPSAVTGGLASSATLPEEAVKDLLVETVDNDSSVHNGVKYSVDLSSSRLKLRVKVPNA